MSKSVVLCATCTPAFRSFSRAAFRNSCCYIFPISSVDFICEPPEKAEFFASLFVITYTWPHYPTPPTNFPSIDYPSTPHTDIEITYQPLGSVTVCKPYGLDGIARIVLEMCTLKLAPVCRRFSQPFPLSFCFVILRNKPKFPIFLNATVSLTQIITTLLFLKRYFVSLKQSSPVKWIRFSNAKDDCARNSMNFD